MSKEKDKEVGKAKKDDLEKEKVKKYLASLGADLDTLVEERVKADKILKRLDRRIQSSRSSDVRFTAEVI